MVARNVCACAVLLASALVLPTNAQRVLLLPGLGSSVNAFAADTFTTASSFSATSGSFTILGNPSATRFFVVSTSNVTVVDGTGNSIQTPVAVGLPISAAAITPDGRKVLVAAGTASAGSLYIFDITGGTMVQSGVVTVGANPSSIAVDQDSSRAFVLTSAMSDGVLKTVDLTNRTIAATLSLAGTSRDSGVVMGPNGLVYVNAQSALYEINASTLTIRKTIAVNAFPTKPVFTPDGTTALLANPGASDTVESALMTVNLADYSISHSIRWFGVNFSSLVWANSTTLYAYSDARRKLYQLSNTLDNLQEASLPGAGAIATVLQIFTSDEFPTASGAPGPKYLFVLAPDKLYRVDLNPFPFATGDQITKSLPVPVASPGGFYFSPVSVNSTPISVIKYGDNQTVAAGSASAPLVIRALDAQSRPIMGLPVTFSPALGSLVSQMTVTNVDGLAQAVAATPDVGGQVTVTATPLGSPGVVFTLNGGSTNPGPGPGPGTPASGIFIDTGNGQVMRGATYAIEPLGVFVRDANGEAQANVPVTFTVVGTAGGMIQGDNCTTPNPPALVCTTNTSGQVEVRFLAPSVLEQTSSYLQMVVTATVSGVNGGANQSVTFYESAVPLAAFGGQQGPLQAQRLIVPSDFSAVINLEAGSTITRAIQVQVFSQSGPFRGGAIPNVGLHTGGGRNQSTGTYNPTPIVCVGGIVLTNGAGIATCDLYSPADATPGTYQIFAIVGGNTGLPINVELTAPPPPVPVATTAAPVSGNNQTGEAGHALSQLLVAVVKNQFGSPMANVAVSWAVISGSATLTSPGSTTDANGRTSTGVTLGSVAGGVVVRLSAGTATPAAFNLTSIVTITLVDIVATSGDGQNVVVGQSFSPVAVRVTVNGGSPQGLPVTFSVTSGSATPSSVSAVTDSGGNASASFTATSSPGQILITASASGLSKTITFTLAARQPGPLLTSASFLNAASFQPGVAFGSVVAIKGVGLTTGLTIPPGTCFSGVADGNLERGLPTTLAGVQVQFSTQIAPIFAVCKNTDGSEQVNVQAPFELAPATITVLVRTGIGTSQEVSTYVGGVAITNAQPGIFEWDADAGTRVAVVARPDGTLVSPTNQARRGEKLRIYTTGLGPVLPSAGGVVVRTNQAGYPGQLPYFTPSVQLGGVGMPGVTAEYARSLIGIYTVEFQVPNDAATGASISLTVAVTTSDGQTITSRPSRISIAP